MIIAFTGARGSGKTLLSKLLAKEIGADVTSFGNYVRKIASERSQSTNLDLQTLGEQLLSENVDIFVSDALKLNGWVEEPGAKNIVIDGIRHSQVAQNLASRGANLGGFILFYIEVDKATRFGRLSGRGEDITTSEKLESHQMEVDLSVEVSPFVTRYLDGKKNVEALVKECLMLINSLASRS